MDSAQKWVDNDHCFACGSKNAAGLQLEFERDGDELLTRISFSEHHQGFDGVVHGGILATVLDDLMSNHLRLIPGHWSTTADLKVRYRKPVPLNTELLFRSVHEGSRGRLHMMSASCSAAAAPETALCTAEARFMEVVRPAE